jgi:hypothetical protein
MIIIMMTIIQYLKIPQKDTTILCQCNSLDANLDFAGFHCHKKNRTEFRGPKIGRSVLGEIQVVSAVRFVNQTTLKSGKTTARAVGERNNATG